MILSDSRYCKIGWIDETLDSFNASISLTFPPKKMLLLCLLIWEFIILTMSLMNWFSSFELAKERILSDSLALISILLLLIKLEMAINLSDDNSSAELSENAQHDQNYK